MYFPLIFEEMMEVQGQWKLRQDMINVRLWDCKFWNQLKATKQNIKLLH